MRNTFRIVLITLAAFGLYYLLQQLFFREIRHWFMQAGLNAGFSHLISYFITGTPLFAAVLIIHGPKRFAESLGLNKSVGKGFVFALLCTLPMLLGYALLFEFDREITFNQVFMGAVVAALIEELYFRAFLYGQLFRFTRLGFIPSVLAGALLFASLHLYQSNEFSTLTGIFITTFSGAVLFAWVMSEWQHNLWVPVFLHFFMNLFWMMFSAGDNALGGWYANIFRAITIALIIVITILYKRRSGERMEINRETLWIKKRQTFQPDGNATSRILD